MKRLILLACASASVLGACASKDPDRIPAIPPTAQGGFVSGGGAFAAGEPQADWWRLFADPALDGLVQEALSANKDLEIAAANLRRVRASLSEARSQRLPSTTVSSSVQYGRQSSAGFQGFDITFDEVTNYDVGLDVSYEVDLFGRVSNTIRAARADARAAEAALNTTRVTVAAETARAYADACSANARMAVARQTLDLQSRTAQLTERLLDAGSGNGLDVARANSQLEAVRATLPSLTAAREEAVFRLATLTGRPPADASAAARACTAIPQVASPIPVGDGASLLARRPDVHEAEAQLTAAAARIGVATADLYPKITLGGSIGATALSLDDLPSNRALRFGLGPLISWSFPNIVAAKARIRQADAAADGALATFDKRVLTALQEVETALSAYANELDRRQALLAARDRSAEAARLGKLRFDAGLDSFLTLLDVQRSLAADEAALAQSQAQVTAYQVQLFKALGGGWQVAQTATPAG